MYLLYIPCVAGKRKEGGAMMADRTKEVSPAVKPKWVRQVEKKRKEEVPGKQLKIYLGSNRPFPPQRSWNLASPFHLLWSPFINTSVGS
jgi:hypothetical protein